MNPTQPDANQPQGQGMAQPQPTMSQPIAPQTMAVPEYQAATSQPPQQGYATPPQAPVQTTGEDPGKTFGIVSLVTSILGMSLIGLIFGILGRKKSKRAGYSNGLAVAGIIISVIGMVIGLGIALLLVFTTASTVQKCQELGPGTHNVDGTTYTCGQQD